tara:strand:+ start:2882 stop:3493 length:612 start_codon:yes stop_codon:yes gene_type:complete
MGKFGWAHITDSNKVAQGPDGAVQFASSSNGTISGSSNFLFNHNANALIITGSMDISGTLRANIFDVKQTTKTEIDVSGSTNFGDDSGDVHNFTGSLYIMSGGLSQYYSASAETTISVQSYNSIIGLQSANYVSLTLPSASVAGPGKILIIKDETDGTRSDANHIAISASTGEKIDHQTTYNLSGDNPALTIYSNGVDKWFIY